MESQFRNPSKKITGWVGEPKGLLQVARERGLIDHNNHHLYSANPKKNPDGTLNDKKSLRSIVGQCTDFQNELTHLQVMANELKVQVMFTPKFHAEMAGEGIEYSWGFAKGSYRRKPLQKKRKRSDFEDLVDECTNVETELTKARIRKFSARARAYLCTYHYLATAEPTAAEPTAAAIQDNDQEKKQKVPMMDEIERLMKKFKTHRCAFDFDRFCDGSWFFESNESYRNKGAVNTERKHKCSFASTINMMTQLDPSFQECSEIHTIQVFREADTIAEPIPQLPQLQRSMANVLSASVPYLDAELYGSTKQVSEMDGIGGDWAIDEMEEDAMLEVPPPPAERRGSDSTLYSFYFETPLVTTANASNLQCQNMEEDPNDDFTITSQDSESFHNTSDLQLDSLQDSTSFWEIGLTAANVVPALNDPQTHLQEHRCISPAHVSLQGEEQRPQPQGPFFSLPSTL